MKHAWLIVTPLVLVSCGHIMGQNPKTPPSSVQAMVLVPVQYQYVPASQVTASANCTACTTGQSSGILSNIKTRVDDKHDRFPNCGYGRTHNDNGVQGTLATKTFYFGGACEFFDEPCRAPQPPTFCEKLYHSIFGPSYHSCKGDCK